MISMDELLRGKVYTRLSTEQQNNINKVLVAVNKVRALWGKPMKVTNGIRTIEEHLAIYKNKGITDSKKIPMKSKHLIGAAVDISDVGLHLTAWLKANPQIMEDCNIYCELGNSNWVHIQILPFGSYHKGGTRWFNP